MSKAPVAKKAKPKHYNNDIIMFGFVSVDATPMCLEYVEKVKLLHHQKSRYQSTVGKDKKYFEKKEGTVSQKRTQLIQRHSNQVIWSLKFL